MARNIEIKARIDERRILLPRARALADGEPRVIDQDDQLLCRAHGRLKLRRFADGSGELIHYHRPDSGEAKASDYVRVPAPDPAALLRSLDARQRPAGPRAQAALAAVGGRHAHPPGPRGRPA
jgi:hypothetical protein